VLAAYGLGSESDLPATGQGLVLGNKLKVTVIGCGPAGLAAAHAAVGHGATVEIIAPKKMSPQNGPLLLQRPIPGVNTDHPDGTIYQRVIGGSVLDYRYKLYGDINIGINGNILQPQYNAWEHRKTYATLWGMYSDLILDCKVSPALLRRMHVHSDLVVSTANAREMCENWEVFGPGKGPHKFLFKEVAITNEFSYPDQPDNTIIFNGGDKYSWVRSSRVFGIPATEWKLGDQPSEARVIRKPISTDCNCYPHVLRTGRFGAWKNETWIDTAYWDVYNAIESMKRGKELENIK
jgi:hypothetical protein